MRKSPRVIASFILGCLCVSISTSSSSSSAAAAAAEEEDKAYAYPMNDPQDAASYHILQMVKWLDGMEEGYFNPKIQIRRANPDDPTSYFGVFAAEDLEQDELLLYIPPEARIHTDVKDGEYTEVLCELAWTLHWEFDRGYNGDYIHYVNYLKQLRRDIIPAVWSREAKDLLMKVQDELYMKDYEPKTAHATHLINWIEEWFQKPCLINPKGKYSLHPYFLAVVTQRGFDNMLVPIYDFFNHHNNNVNIYNRKSIYHRTGFDVYASRFVEKGEELFFSYHNCPDCKECVDCDSSQTYWGTPEMLRDFGFVEPYPHTFYLGDYMTFVVSNATLGTKEPTLQDLSIEYMDETYPSAGIVAEAKREWVRIENVYQNDILAADTTKIAPHELYTITQYYKALVNAFKLMVITFDPELAAKMEAEEAEEEEEMEGGEHVEDHEEWEDEEVEECVEENEESSEDLFLAEMDHQEESEDEEDQC
ncbi:unnamed protein product [Cylindrotheca closterium]|uniref:SET domain-containing protein n=1 Tax=Cylindrotheca closterium TaxID=2856 RepID=A0AAD2CHA7_9STRA|nr:unnamed protein product [Cylindrotheca closterium]CAJ1936063.1 unnamed protein product [Cylindrotheca closterium]